MLLTTAVQKLIFRPLSTYPITTVSKFFTSESGSNNSLSPERAELPRVQNLVEGCDYTHWFVVMEAPKGYPQRDEIINLYIKTLEIALGSEDKAKKAIYSVSTKYYYAFGCEISENLVFKLKSLPNVKWVLPDSYLGFEDNGYGGEPFLDGKVVPYDDNYHYDWMRIHTDDNPKGTSHSRKARGKQNKQ